MYHFHNLRCFCKRNLTDAAYTHYNLDAKLVNIVNHKVVAAVTQELVHHPHCYIMTELTFIAMSALSLLCTSLFTRQAQATETCMCGCSTDEMRRAELRRVLDNSGCNNYSCGKP